MNFIIIFTFAFLFTGVMMYVWHGGLVQKQTLALKSLLAVDDQLAKRNQALSTLLRFAHDYMEHERPLILKIKLLRHTLDINYSNSYSHEIKQHLTVAAELDALLDQLITALEFYPDLSLLESTEQIQAAYHQLDRSLASVRRLYNRHVISFNNSVEIFPGNLVALLAGMKSLPLYETRSA